MKAINICLILYFLILNVFGVLWCLHIYNNERDAGNWPSTFATIKSTRIFELKGKFGTLHCLGLSYEFEIVQKKFNSFGTLKCNGNESKIQALSTSYKTGSKVQIFYNPDNPSWGWLSPPNRGNVFWYLLFFANICSLGLFLIVKFLFKSTKNESIELWYLTHPSSHVPWATCLPARINQLVPRGYAPKVA